MKAIRFAAAMLAATCIAGAAHAATITQQYKAFSHTVGAQATPEHSVYFAGGHNPAGSSGPKNNHFLFENAMPGNGVFTQFDDGTATLTGNVKNAGGDEYALNLFMEATGTPASLKLPPVPAGQSIDTSAWTFYSISTSIDSTLTYLGAGSLASFKLTEMDMTKAVQVGVGANDKNWDLLGLSTWINFTDLACTGNCQPSYGGDINITLAAVPLPASLPLVLLGLGGLGYAARRRQTA